MPKSKEKGYDYITVRVRKHWKKKLEIRKRRTGDDFGDMCRPFLKALVEDTERLFGHLPEFKQIKEEDA